MIKNNNNDVEHKETSFTTVQCRADSERVHERGIGSHITSPLQQANALVCGELTKGNNTECTSQDMIRDETYRVTKRKKN